jgi:hypothetical protein
MEDTVDSGEVCHGAFPVVEHRHKVLEYKNISEMLHKLNLSDDLTSFENMSQS